MAFNEIYSKKLDEKGEPIIENGDFVMELISSVEVPGIIEEPSNIVTIDITDKNSVNLLIEKLTNLNK